MNRTLSETVMDRAERLALTKGFSSVSDYLSQLLEREESQDVGLSGREADVEAALVEGLASGPATPLTTSDWDELKRRVYAVHTAARK